MPKLMYSWLVRGAICVGNVKSNDVEACKVKKVFIYHHLYIDKSLIIAYSSQNSYVLSYPHILYTYPSKPLTPDQGVRVWGVRVGVQSKIPQGYPCYSLDEEMLAVGMEIGTSLQDLGL